MTYSTKGARTNSKRICTLEAQHAVYLFGPVRLIYHFWYMKKHFYMKNYHLHITTEHGFKEKTTAQVMFMSTISDTKIKYIRPISKTDSQTYTRAPFCWFLMAPYSVLEWFFKIILKII